MAHLDPADLNEGDILINSGEYWYVDRVGSSLFGSTPDIVIAKPRLRGLTLIGGGRPRKEIDPDQLQHFVRCADCGIGEFKVSREKAEEMKGRK